MEIFLMNSIRKYRMQVSCNNTLCVSFIILFEVILRIRNLFQIGNIHKEINILNRVKPVPGEILTISHLHLYTYKIITRRNRDDLRTSRLQI